MNLESLHIMIKMLIYGLLLACCGGCILFSKQRLAPDNKQVAFLLEPFPYKKQRHEKDCGVIAEYQTLKYLGYNITYNEIIDGMKWNPKIGNLTDTHKNHKILLEKFGVPHQIVLSGMQNNIINSIKKNKPCIVLVRTGKISWHWISVVAFYENKWIISWGNGYPNTITSEYFSTIFTGICIFFN